MLILLKIKKDEKYITKGFDLFPRLEERKKQFAGTLSGGERKMLAIVRGLMSDPKLMQVDEPSLGLALKLELSFFCNFERTY